MTSPIVHLYYIILGKWDRQATSEPKTKFEISWTGQLALEEGYGDYSYYMSIVLWLYII